jgi:aspartate aminotransferase
VTLNGSMDLAGYLLDHGRIAVVPGKAFGADEYIRISFATSMENVLEGIKRFTEALKG